MSNMRQTVTTVSSSSANNHENHLDALLDDLQSSISRTGPNAHMNGNVSGFREVRRTVSDGTPEGTTTEYHIEYLHPANTTTHITESTNHNSLANSGDYGFKSSYKDAYKYGSTSTKETGGGDLRLRQNISELDSLLDDLNTSKNSFSDELVPHRNLTGIDSGLLEPVTSTPHVSRTVERHYREEKRSRGRSSSPISAKRELVFTGGRSLDPSPVRHETFFQEQRGPLRQQVYRYEKTTTTRTTAPTITDITPLDSGSRSYNYMTDESPPALTYRSPSPYYSSTTSREGVSQSPLPHSVERIEKTTKYNNARDGFSPDRRDPSPQRSYSGNKSSSHYSYSSTRESRETRGEVPKTPPPHRSPSPVSFPQPPQPSSKTISKTYHFDQSGAPIQSPPPGPKFSPSDPSRTNLPYNASPPQHTVTTYKYTTNTTSSNRYPEEVPLLPRPFPNPSPSPTPEQQPPKKLEELMASFSDTENLQYHSHHESSNKRHEVHTETGPRDVRQTPPQEKSMKVAKITEKKDETKNIAGPPVYYPPGELFTKKEEAMMQKQVGGGKYKEKSKYEYEAKSKSKSKESSGKAVVPVCIPLCCGMPCVIM